MEPLKIYLIVVNMVSFIIMGIDKYRAQTNKWRISEKSIFMLGIIGGGIGILLGMRAFRHKTRHRSFVIGIPIIVILNIFMFGYLLQNFK